MSGGTQLSGVTDDGETHRTDEGERPGGGRADRTRPTLSSDGTYVLLWGVIALIAAVLSFDGAVGAVVVLAGGAGVVGLYAAAHDLRGHPPTSLEYLWMGTPALLAAGIASLSGRFVVAGGLGVVALATLIEGYGWFGAGTNEEGGGG